MTTTAMTPGRLSILLAAARTFAARHRDSSPEITYHYWTAAARLRSTGRRALVRADHDHHLPEGGEAFMTAVVRAVLTAQPEPTTPGPAFRCGLADTGDGDLATLVTALASYLHHRTLARLHRDCRMETASSDHEASALGHLDRAAGLLTGMLGG